MRLLNGIDNCVFGESDIFALKRMDPRYSMKLQNCYNSDGGGIAKKPGYVKVNQVPVVPMDSVYEFKMVDGTSTIITAGTGNIYKLSALNELTELKTGWQDNRKVYFSTVGDLLFMSNGLNTAQKYDGTTVSDIGGSAPDNILKTRMIHKRLWAIVENSNSPRYSALLNPEDWTVAGGGGQMEPKFNLSHGDVLYDLMEIKNFLVMFFSKHILIYSGTDPSNYVLYATFQNLGCVYPGTVELIGTELMFLHGSGVKTLSQVLQSGDLKDNDLSDHKAGSIQESIANNTGNIYSIAHYSKRGWYLFVIGETVWVYNYSKLRKAWSRIVGADIKAVYTASNGTLYAVGNRGYLYKYDSGWTFDGINPVMAWDGPWLKLAPSGGKCFPTIMKVMFRPSVVAAITYGLRYNSSTTMPANTNSFNTPEMPSLLDETPMEEFYFDDSKQYEEVQLRLFGAGEYAQPFFINESDKGPIEFQGVRIFGQIGGL